MSGCPAIVEISLWEAVQAKLNAHPQGGDRSVYRRTVSLLAGKIVDETGTPLIPVHSSKPDVAGCGRRRFSYYVSRKLHHARSGQGVRIPAREIEGLVVARLAALFDDPIELIVQAGLQVAPDRFQHVAHTAAATAKRVRARDHDLLSVLIDRVAVLPRAVEVSCSPAAIEAVLELPVGDRDHPPMTIVVPAQITRSGIAMRLIQGGVTPAVPQQSLIRLIVQARTWWKELRLGAINVTALAERERLNASYVTRVLRLAFLAPTAVDAILVGRQRSGLNAAALVATDAVSPSWDMQLQQLIAA